MTTPVEIRVGSDSDLPKIERVFATLEALQVSFEARVLSAHRTPQRMAARARELESAGFRVCIAAAGGSAHLPGMTASVEMLSGKKTVLHYLLKPLSRARDGLHEK